MFILLDESGDFFKKDDYFVVGGFVTDNPKRTAKAFRKWQQGKFKKQLRYRTEVKFTDTRLTDKLRAQTLQHFIKQDIRIFYTYLGTKNIPAEYRRKGRIETGKLYTNIVVHTIGFVLPSKQTEVSVMIDPRQLKNITGAEFRDTVKSSIVFQLPKGAAVYVTTPDSTTNVNIQIADWICGALYQYHIGKKAGAQFYEILKEHIIKQEEFFKDFWSEFNNKKAPPER